MTDAVAADGRVAPGGGIGIVGIVGSGVMRAGIAQVALARGHRVLLADARPDAAARADENISRALAREVEASLFLPMDVMADGQLEAVFDRIAADWGALDFVVHSIAFSTRDALGGRVTPVASGRCSPQKGSAPRL